MCIVRCLGRFQAARVAQQRQNVTSVTLVRPWVISGDSSSCGQARVQPRKSLRKRFWPLAPPQHMSEFACGFALGHQRVAGLLRESLKVAHGAGVGRQHPQQLAALQRGKRFFGAQDGQGAVQAAGVYFSGGRRAGVFLHGGAEKVWRRRFLLLYQ